MDPTQPMDNNHDSHVKSTRVVKEFWQKAASQEPPPQLPNPLGDPSSAVLAQLMVTSNRQTYVVASSPVFGRTEPSFLAQGPVDNFT